jgi:hypothetical protein
MSSSLPFAAAHQVYVLVGSGGEFAVGCRQKVMNRAANRAHHRLFTCTPVLIVKALVGHRQRAFSHSSRTPHQGQSSKTAKPQAFN